MTNQPIASAALSLFAAVFTLESGTVGLDVKESLKIETQMDFDYVALEKLGTYRVKPYKARRSIKLIDVDAWPSEADQFDNASQRRQTAPMNAIIPLGSILYVRMDLDSDRVDVEVLGHPKETRVYSMTILQWRGIRGFCGKLKDTKVYGSLAEGLAGLAVKR